MPSTRSERALAKLGVEDPASLRSPRPVEEALSPTALPYGTLLVLIPSELRAAEVDIEETVKDERSGGSVWVTLPLEAELETRKRSLRELAVSTPTFCTTSAGTLPPGMSRLTGRAASETSWPTTRSCSPTRPGFRVAVVRRRLPGGGWIALWTGNEQAIAELGGAMRGLAADAGHGGARHRARRSPRSRACTPYATSGPRRRTSAPTASCGRPSSARSPARPR